MHTPRTWLGVELRHFIALEAVAEESSFNRAAARLGYTQSAVSQQIAALERTVGQRLVERRGGSQPIGLTEAGEILLEHAQAIRARMELAHADLQAHLAGALGPLRIGTFQSVGALLLPQLLRLFVADNPNVQISLVESHLDQAFFDRLLNGELDVAFVHLPIPPGPFAHRETYEDEYVLLVPRDSPLADQAVSPSIEALSSLPLVGFQNCKSFEQVIGYFHGLGLEPNFVMRSDDSATIQAFVAAGFGFALVPRLVADSAMPELAVITLTNGPPARKIAIAWSTERRLSLVLEAFISRAVEALRLEEQRRRCEIRISVEATA